MASEEPATIHIRADAGGTLGTGHVMRMLALSPAWQERGGAVHLAACSCPEALVQRLEKEGVHFHALATDTLGGKEDIKESLELGRSLGSEWIVLDGYKGVSLLLRARRAILGL
jgi:hypothetical protein